MAKFELEHTEGMRWIKVTLNNEVVRAEKGALNHMVGNITMDAPIPSPHAVIVSMVSDESAVRPSYKGTGDLYLESSLGGFHTLQINEGETWVLQNGAYWASEDGVKLSIYRESALTSFFAGEGFFWFQTKLTGSGQAVLVTPGPIDEVELHGEQLVAAGNFVIARTAGIAFTVRRAARSRLAHYLSGEPYARVYTGTGRLLMATTPYWRLRLDHKSLSHDPARLQVS